MMNQPGKRAYLRLLRKILLSLVILYLCTMPLFYAEILAALRGGWSSPNPNLACRGIRFLAVIAVSWIIRKKRKETAFQDRQLSKATMFHIGLFCLSLLLQAHKVFLLLDMTISHMIGITPREGLPSFFAVLWSEIFSSGNLFWSTLLCMTVVFFHVPKQYFQKFRFRSKRWINDITRQG